MGDHASEKLPTGEATSSTSRPGEAFWSNAARGGSSPLVDPRDSSKPADASAMLPYVDADDVGPVDWGAEVRQNEFEQRRKRQQVSDKRTPVGSVSERVQGLPTQFTIGEQVVGSTHRFVIATPKTMGGLTAMVTPTIRPAAGYEGRKTGFSPDRPSTGFLRFSSTPFDLAVVFEPAHAGPIAADLDLLLHWTDGTVETVTITLLASARLRTEIPADQVPESQTSKLARAAEAQTPTGAASKTSDKHSAREFERLADATHRAVDSLNDRQVDGVDLASNEAASFVRKPPETGFMYDLMELAVSLGVAGLAGVIGRQLGVHLAKMLSNPDNGLAALGFTDAIKDGIKRAGNNAAVRQNTVEHLPGGPHREKHDAGITSTDQVAIEPPSTNGRIAFFAHQKAMLRDTADANHELVDAQVEKLTQLLDAHPEAALAALEALRDVMLAARNEDASRLQANQSAVQWVAAVGRASLGAANASTHDGSFRRQVSNMEKYGPIKDGVLVIAAVLVGDRLELQSASMRGVSLELADRLSSMPLKDLLMPIRIEVGFAAIHIDEARRIRVSGVLDSKDAIPVAHYIRGQNAPEQLEAQNTNRAETLVAGIMDTALEAHGVAVQTDDHSGRGDRK